MDNVIKINFGGNTAQLKTKNQAKDVVLTNALKGKFDQINTEIEAITEHLDHSFVYNANDFDYYFEDIDAEEIRCCFDKNYSSNSLGINKLDTLSSEELLSLWDDLNLCDDRFAQLINEHSTVEAADFHVYHNEMSSASIGEHEHQIDVEYHEDLKSMLGDLTDDELALYNSDKPSHNKVDRDSFHVYGNPCDRLILKLDPETFLSEFRSIIKDNI